VTRRVIDSLRAVPPAAAEARRVRLTKSVGEAAHAASAAAGIDIATPEPTARASPATSWTSRVFPIHDPSAGRQPRPNPPDHTAIRSDDPETVTLTRPPTAARPGENILVTGIT
jgi:hypothetical protein